MLEFNWYGTLDDKLVCLGRLPQSTELPTFWRTGCKVSGPFFSYVSLQQHYIMTWYSVHPIEMQHNRVVYTYGGFFFLQTPGIMHPMKIAHTLVPKEMGSLLARKPSIVFHPMEITRKCKCPPICGFFW
jgi:hypothetical protein